MRHPRRKQSFSLCLAAVTSALTLVACEVGEAGDSLSEPEAIELFEVINGDDPEALEIGYAGSCIHGEFQRSGNRITGWAIDLCPEEPGRPAGALQVYAAFELGDFALGSGWYEGRRWQGYSTGRWCGAHVSGWVTSCLPNVHTTVTVDGRSYSGKYGYSFDLLGPDVLARATPERVRLAEAWNIIDPAYVDLPLDLGSFPAASGGGTSSGPQTYTLTIAKYGTPQVSIDNPGLSCTAARCTADLPEGTRVRITNEASNTYTGLYGPGCSGTSCTVTMSANKSLTAYTFGNF